MKYESALARWVAGRWLPMIGLVLTLGLFAGIPSVYAFKAGTDFRKTASAGGGGGIYFSGAPDRRKWDCTMCHTGRADKLRIVLDVTPKSLLTQRRYVPGMAYQITFKLEGEHLGFKSALNTNGMVASVLNGKNLSAGVFSGFDAAEISEGSHEAEIATTGLYEQRKSWTVTWTAPPRKTGPVTFYVAMVDGNGADDDVTRTSDPDGDDVKIGMIELAEE